MLGYAIQVQYRCTDVKLPLLVAVALLRRGLHDTIDRHHTKPLKRGSRHSPLLMNLTCESNPLWPGMR